ncbi:MAG: phosphatase PAP2 family protein [Lachnospiraceae bacterium]|nr:phosphatase PAP2 family protein [Lachnospiraceae bacterium]
MNWLQTVDENILLFIQNNMRIEVMNGFWKGITSLGNSGWFWIIVSVLLLISSKTRKVGILALLSLGVGFLITNVCLKNLIARPRPFAEIEALTILIKAPHDFSFPSGHTCASFAVAGIYFKMLPKKYGLSAIILAVLIGFSRLYVGVHYPTDVLGGLIIGLGSSALVYFLYKKLLTTSK